MLPLARDQCQSTGTFQPDTVVISFIHFAPGEACQKRHLPGVIQLQREIREFAEERTAWCAWGFASAARHQRQCSRSVRPNARFVSIGHAAAGETGLKRDLARVVERDCSIDAE